MIEIKLVRESRTFRFELRDFSKNKATTIITFLFASFSL